MTQVAAQTQPQPITAMDDVFPGLNVLLMGPSGTGKTYSLGTIPEKYEVFYLGMEQGLESLIGYWTDKGKEVPANFHWHTLPYHKTNFAQLANMAQKVTTFSGEALAKFQDPNRMRYNRFELMLTALSNFPDDRTGQKFGSVDSWDHARVIVIDGMTGINDAAMSMVVGGKPVRSQQDWQVAQNQVNAFLMTLTTACNCHVIVIAHVEREVDQILGGIKLTVGTLGKALAPKIPAMFSDVILTVRQGKEWSWDTANGQADLKTRNLPISSSLKPDLSQVFSKWESRRIGMKK